MNAPVAKHPLVVFKEQLDTRMEQFRHALPAHMPPERFARVLLTAVQNNADLLGADRQSLWNACMRAAQDGLLPDGREGAIVLYGKQAQWMPMVAGIQKKARNSGELSGITARVVYYEDKFRYWIDEQGEHLLYEPGDSPDTTKVRLVFAMARTKDGELFVEPMSVAEIEKVRAISKAKNNGPWVTWWGEMAKKTAIRRLSKRLPMSSDLDDLVRRDDDLYDFDKPAPQVVDLSGVAIEGEVRHPDQRQPPTAGGERATQSPSGGGSAGADAPKADGASGGERDTPPAETDQSAGDAWTELESSIASALIDCRVPKDVDAVERMYAIDLQSAPPAEQQRIAQQFANVREAMANRSDDFPGDRK